MDIDDRRARFRSLHTSGTFLIPNPYDVGSCRLLTALGFDALATTSSGSAASYGRLDMTVDRDELVSHVRALAAATDLPLSVDAERCFPDEPGGVAGTVRLLADAGAAGCSLEDWDPSVGRIEDLPAAADRVAEAAVEAEQQGMVLTARAENHLRGVDDLDDTVARLQAYRAAGAHCVFAPGISDLAAIARLVDETGAPVNALVGPGGPTKDQLANLGVRRISVGGSLARSAYGALVDAARNLLDTGTLDSGVPLLSRELAAAAFAAPVS